MIFQEIRLIPTLDDDAKHLPQTRGEGVPSVSSTTRAAECRAGTLFDMLEVKIDPKALVGDLGAGRRRLPESPRRIR